MKLAGVLWVVGMWSGLSFACAPLPQGGKDQRNGQWAKVAPGAKATAVVFLSAKCPCSRGYEPVLTRLSQQFPDVNFIGVHSNRDEEDSLATYHFRQGALPFPVLRDTQGQWANAFGALKTPHAFVVSPDGQCLFRGGLGDRRDPEKASKHYLEDALKAVVAGREPPVKEAKALGCLVTR